MSAGAAGGQVGGFVLAATGDLARLAPQWLLATLNVRANPEAARLAGDGSGRPGQRAMCAAALAAALERGCVMRGPVAFWHSPRREVKSQDVNLQLNLQLLCRVDPNSSSQQAKPEPRSALVTLHAWTLNVLSGWPVDAQPL